MKISRRDFIQLGAAALLAGVLPESEQPTETCGRCKKPIDTETAEMCWYCEAWMCYECWNEYGHCGHSEADAQNANSKWEWLDTDGEWKPHPDLALDPTPAEQAYAKALEMIPEFEQMEKQAALGVQIAREHVFTSKDCEQAGQAMMDGFMSGIKKPIHWPAPLGWHNYIWVAPSEIGEVYFEGENDNS